MREESERMQNSNRGPTNRLNRVALHVLQPAVAYRVQQDLDILLPPGENFLYKQFLYYMDGIYQGELRLSGDHRCHFNSARGEPGINTFHGRWHFCQHNGGLKAHFDYGNRAHLAEKKWTFLRGNIGIDYEGREIVVYPNGTWVMGANRRPVFQPQLQLAPPPPPVPPPSSPRGPAAAAVPIPWGGMQQLGLPVSTVQVGRASSPYTAGMPASSSTTQVSRA